MRILFCTPAPLTKSLGAAKVVVELAEEMRELGWDCDLVSIPDLADQSGLSMSESLRRYLQEHATDYDVVDYDHSFLPYLRADFPSQTLFVARSVLLAHHFAEIAIPTSRGWKQSGRHLFLGRAEMRARDKRIQYAHHTVQEADIVNVCNEDDSAELIRCGIPSERIVLIPFGISRSRRPLFDAVSSASPINPVVAFVGTFDYRKGAQEFPALVEEVLRAVPETRFRLLGTAGMFATADAVLAHFPERLQRNVEVVPKFHPDELPSLLASCSVGVFPSYIEGMPFGVLEMLAASVPVIAYDAPGPPMMLPPECLVPRGDTIAMGDKVLALLADANKLQAAREWAQRHSQQFRWERVAQTTSDVYSRHLEMKRRQTLSLH